MKIVCNVSQCLNPYHGPQSLRWVSTEDPFRKCFTFFAQCSVCKTWGFCIKTTAQCANGDADEATIGTVYVPDIQAPPPHHAGRVSNVERAGRV
jgi:hypothetical protein